MRTGRHALCKVITLAVSLGLGNLMATANTNAGEAPPPGAKVVHAPQRKEGSWWQLKMWGADFGEVTVVERVKPEKEERFTIQRGNSEFTFSNGSHLLVGHNSDAGVWIKYFPGLPPYVFPFWEGKMWSGRVDRNTEGRFSYLDRSVAVRLEFKQWERIQVPSGQLHFYALRIEVTYGDSKATCWYAEEAQHLVRCISPDIGDPWYNFDLTAFYIAREGAQ